MFKHTLLAAAFSLLSAGFAADAKAGSHGSFILRNPTSKTLHYQIKWGENSSWQSESLPPGIERAHYHPLDENGRAPVPYIRFDYIGGDGRITYKRYELDFYEVYNPWNGNRYVFRYSRSGRYLDLYEES